MIFVNLITSLPRLKLSALSFVNVFS